MSGELAFFELGVEDPERARRFYEAMFGWTFTPGPGGDGYFVSTPSVPGGVHGGDPGARPYTFFRVADMEHALARVRELGGEVVDIDIEGDAEAQARFGRFKLCRDDQGSEFGLFEAPRG